MTPIRNHTLEQMRKRSFNFDQEIRSTKVRSVGLTETIKSQIRKYRNDQKQPSNVSCSRLILDNNCYNNFYRSLNWFYKSFNTAQMQTNTNLKTWRNNVDRIALEQQTSDRIYWDLLHMRGSRVAICLVRDIRWCYHSVNWPLARIELKKWNQFWRVFHFNLVFSFIFLLFICRHLSSAAWKRS